MRPFIDAIMADTQDPDRERRSARLNRLRFPISIWTAWNPFGSFLAERSGGILRKVYDWGSASILFLYGGFLYMTFVRMPLAEIIEIGMHYAPVQRSR